MMFWRMALIVMLIAAAACGGKKVAVEEPTSPPVREARVRESYQSIDELQNRLGVREFTFRKAERPRLRVVIENLQADAAMTFEVSSVFYDADGREVDRKAWSEVTLDPGRRHVYLGETVHKESTAADLLIRELETSAEN